MIDYVLNYSNKNKRPIILIYQKQLEVIQRRIKVTQLSDEMVQGYCYEKKALRSFKMDFILAAFIPDIVERSYERGDWPKFV